MPSNNITHGITGFLDILGFGERVLAAKNISDVDDIARLVNRIQHEFEFNSKDKVTNEIHENLKKTVLAFSDSIIVNIPLQSEFSEAAGVFDTLLCAVYDVGLAQGMCVGENLFIRGGLDLGWWYKQEHTLISDGLVRAYRTEQTAVVPVIAVTDKLFSYLSNNKDRQTYHESIDPINNLFRLYEGVSGRKKIKFWYIDYISIVTRSLDWIVSREQRDAYSKGTSEQKQEIMDEGLSKNIDKWLTLHARNVEQGYNNSSSKKIKYKYEWLSEYHNEIAETFTSTESCLCSLK